MNRKRTHLFQLLLVVMVVLSSVVTIVPAPAALATEYEDDEWIVELWSDRKWVEPGGVITYHLRVVRLGPPVPEVVLSDQRDENDTTGYLTISPPPSAGGGTSDYAEWNLGAMNPGDTWQAEYQVQVSSSASGMLATNAFGPWVHNWIEGVQSQSHYIQLGDEPVNPTSGADKTAETTGDPINAGSGEHYVDPVVDFNLGGPLPLTFKRYYASGLHVEEVVTSTLGANWMHNFDLRVAGGTFFRAVAFERGKVIYYTFVWGNDYMHNFHQEPIPYRLEKATWDGGTRLWLLDPIRERMYLFNTKWSDKGFLEEIWDRNENRLVVSRDGVDRITQVADGLGRALNFTYTGDRLTQVSDGVRHVDFTYDGNGHLTTAADAEAHTTTHAYNPDLTHGPLLTGQTRPLTNTPYTQTYNTEGQVTQQADAYANTTTVKYNTPAAGQTTVTHQDATTYVFTHEDQRLGAATQDQAGNTGTREFDDRERLTALHDRLGDTTSVTYHDESGKIASFTDAEGYTTTFTYEAQDQAFVNPINPSEVVTFTFYNLTRVDYPDTLAIRGTNAIYETFTYDDRGNVKTYTDRLGKTWTYECNSQGLVTKVTNPSGGVVDYAYNADGTLASSTDSDVGTITYGYDAYRRMDLVTRPDSSTVQFSYDNNDRLLTVTDELSRTITWTYDDNGNLDTAANPLNQTVTYAHDLMDRLAGRSDPLAQSSAYAYDEMGRLETFTDRNNHTWTYGYDARGWLDEVTGPEGKTWTTAYDDEGVPTAFTTPLGHTWGSQTDNLGRTTRVTDPLSRQANYVYDELGRLTSASDRLGRITTYAYDDAGRLVGATKPVIGTATYGRNDLGQLSHITNLRGKNWDFGYSNMGRLTSHDDPLGRQRTYGYDTRGRLDQITYPGDLGTTTITYDDASQVSQAAYPGGPTLDYAYDDAGRLLATDHLTLTYDVRGDVIASQDKDGASFGVTYDSGRRLETVTYDGQAMVTYTYDGRNLLTGVEDDRSGAWLTFAYDDDGRLTAINRSSGANTTFDYDDAGRVTGIHDGALADQSYTLNAEGEPTQVVRSLPLDSLPPEPDLSLTFDDANQISSPGYAYDARGRQTAAPGETYAYDGASRLTQVTSGTLTVDLTYNGLNDLRTRTAAGTTTTYYHNYALGLASTVAEKEGGAYKRLYVYTPGGSLLYSIDPATNGPSSEGVRFYHYDRVGSTLFLTNDGGSVTDAYAYDPYGNALGHTGPSDQPFTYVGRYGVRHEPVGELYDMRARAYDPATTRFLTRDPIWPVLAVPESLNPYQYAHQNPLRYIDPQGTEAVVVVVAVTSYVVATLIPQVYFWINDPYRDAPNNAETVVINIGPPEGSNEGPAHKLPDWGEVETSEEQYPYTHLDPVLTQPDVVVPTNVPLSPPDVVVTVQVKLSPPGREALRKELRRLWKRLGEDKFQQWWEKSAPPIQWWDLLPPEFKAGAITPFD